jgi:uncharacterized membrane protein
MIRKQLAAGRHLTGEADFRWRGIEVTRLEGFTDAVFAFAVTLLVVSLEVPKTFPELMHAMRGFLAFGVCFAMLTNVWYQHYRFFRRYGLENPYCVFLNCALLFFVLFYVYPLKFLFAAMFNNDGFSPQQARTVFTIFSAGWAAVFMVFALLYRHAWQIQHEMALSPLERMRTRHSLIDQCAMVIIGLVSVLIAWTVPAAWIGLAGYIYFAVGLYFTLAGMVFGKQERELRLGSHAAAG